MIKNIIDTLLSTYDLSLNNDERRKNFEIINNYQENVFALVDLQVLLSSSSVQQVKIFGFNCLENFILYKWNSADKDVAKSYLFQIIKEYGNFALDESAERVVRWLIAKTIVYYIRHECPQNCDTIIVDLINLKENGIMTQALILSIFFCLSETLPNDCQMPDKRKKEVISFVTDQSCIIMSFCIDVIQKHFMTCHTDGINLPVESIKTIQSLSSWIKFETLLSLSESILSVVINSLVVDSSDYYLLEVLETIFDRKVRPEERYNLFLKLVQNDSLWQTFLANISTGLNIPINPYLDDKFRYLQKMFDLLLIVGNLVIDNWQHFFKDSSSHKINDLMDLILMATHHPVKLLSVEFLSFWCNGFKSDQESLRNVLVSKAQSLLPLLKAMSIKQSVRNPSNIDYEYLKNLIEDSESDAYAARISIVTGKTITILTQYFTQDILALTLEWVFNITNTIKEIEDKNPESLKILDSSCDLIKELKGCRFFTRCVMHSIFKPYSKMLRESVHNVVSSCSPEVLSRSKSITGAILATKDVNIDISSTYLENLCLLLPLVADDQHIIEKCLEKIFNWFNKIETVDPLCKEFGILKQLTFDCGVWLLRIFRDYDFLIPVPLFENILSYHRSTCSPIYSRPNIIEALTLYICQRVDYTIEQKKALLAPFVESIHSVLCSEQVFRIFENGSSVVRFLQMERPKPNNSDGINYPSTEHVQLKLTLIRALPSLLGLCRRFSTDQNESETVTISNKSVEMPSIIAGSMTDSILPMLPSLFVIIRSLNQIWSVDNIHPDFNKLKEMSLHYREALMQQNSNTDKYSLNSEQDVGDAYVLSCQSFISKIQETIWSILAKCCFNFGTKLYSLREWSLGITDYVFADLGSVPNFKIMTLIKIFLIPFVQYCPTDLAADVLVPSIVPFVNYLFQRLDERWALVVNDTSSKDVDECNMDNESTEGNTDLSNEIIEEQILRIISKAFVTLFRLTMTIGCSSVEDTKPIQRLGVLGDILCRPSTNSDNPMIMIFLNHLCRSITWRDSFCASRLCQLIIPFVHQITSHGLLTIEVIIFIFQQSINVLNIFAGKNHNDIRLSIVNIGVFLYDEYLSKQPDFMERFVQLLDKSSSKDLHTFQHKMQSSTTAKVKRDAFQKILEPYVGVPTNEMFSQKVLIKNLPPLLKPEWKSKNQRRLSLDNGEPLSLSSLFD